MEHYNKLITNLIAAAKDMAQSQHISMCEAIDRSATLFDEKGLYISTDDFLNLMADFRNR